jgi:5-methylcytosine-specific restriction protein A
MGMRTLPRKGVVMPVSKPKKPCNHPGCLILIPSGERFCERHAELKEKAYDKRRGSSTSRGYDGKWRKLRALKARIDPLCEVCLKRGVTVPLDVVHHVRPIDTHPELRLSLDNLESLCKAHHDKIHEGERWK